MRILPSVSECHFSVIPWEIFGVSSMIFFYPAGLAPAVAESLFSPLGFNCGCGAVAPLCIKKKKKKCGLH